MHEATRPLSVLVDELEDPEQVQALAGLLELTSVTSRGEAHNAELGRLAVIARSHAAAVRHSDIHPCTYEH